MGGASTPPREFPLYRMLVPPRQKSAAKNFRGETHGNEREGGGREAQAGRGGEARAQSDGRAGAQGGGGARGGGQAAAEAGREESQVLGRNLPHLARRARRTLLRAAPELLRPLL